MANKLLRDHPQRIELNNEVHARPPVAVRRPARVTYVASYADAAEAESELDLLSELARDHGAAPPEPGATHYELALTESRLRWERHTEFSRYMLIADADGTEPFESSAISTLPADWISRLPGEAMVATNVALVAGNVDASKYEELSRQYFSGHPLIGGALANGAASALTDLRIREDGFSRLLVFNGSMSPRQAGRMIQRILEIDTYRVMALLALPVARELTPFLLRSETELADVTNTLLQEGETDEAQLLNQLTRLQASLENRQSVNNFRFGASAAYSDIIDRRIAELREERLEGLQTFQEFTERRLAPAMNTCEVVAKRQESVSRRAARATQLLSTRVGVGRAKQNQELLSSMNRRAAFQLRLQQTVEGLSVAAITYYVVSLIDYLAESLALIDDSLEPRIITALSIPVVALIVALGVRTVRKQLTRTTDG